MRGFFTFETMCQPTKSFTLCSCTVEWDLIFGFKSRTPPKPRGHGRYSKPDAKPEPVEPAFPYFVWILRRVLETIETAFIGRMILPVDELGETLTADSIAYELNARNCFDFEYQPAESDSLDIRRVDGSYDTKYIAFTFGDGEWAPELSSHRLHDDCTWQTLGQGHFVLDNE